jgi:hypothetical protein
LPLVVMVDLFVSDVPFDGAGVVIVVGYSSSLMCFSFLILIF